jgi:hypothetical protein
MVSKHSRHCYIANPDDSAVFELIDAKLPAGLSRPPDSGLTTSETSVAPPSLGQILRIASTVWDRLGMAQMARGGTMR